MAVGEAIRMLAFRCLGESSERLHYSQFKAQGKNSPPGREIAQSIRKTFDYLFFSMMARAFSVWEAEPFLWLRNG